MEDGRSHYGVRLRLDGVERLMVWYSDESDGVLTSSPGRIALFKDPAEVERYATQQNLKLEPEPVALYDFDRLAQWLAQPSREALDCRFLLDAWNMLCDVAFSVGAKIEERRDAQGVYDKLFWGCNLPSMTPPGEHFEPRWSDEDVLILSEVLSSGLRLLRGAVRHAA